MSIRACSTVSARRSARTASSATSGWRTRAPCGCGAGPPPPSPAGRRCPSPRCGTARPYVFRLEAPSRRRSRRDVEAWLVVSAAERKLARGKGRAAAAPALAAAAPLLSAPGGVGAGPRGRDAAASRARRSRRARGVGDPGLLPRRSDNQPTSQIHGIAMHLKAISQAYVGVAPSRCSRSWAGWSPGGAAATGMTVKNRLALKQLEDPMLLARLIRLPAATYARLPGPTAGDAAQGPALPDRPSRCRSCCPRRSAWAIWPGSSSTAI